MKKTLLIILPLLLIVGCSKVEGKSFNVVETYKNGNPKIVKTYKESNNKLELVKEIAWHDNGEKEEERTYKDGELVK